MINITIVCDRKDCNKSKEYSGHLTIKKFEDKINKDWTFQITKGRKRVVLCQDCIKDARDKIDKAVEKEEKEIYKDV